MLPGQLRDDLPELILAVMCITLGLMVFLIQCCLRAFTNMGRWSRLVMGAGAMLLGGWAIRNLPSFALLFPGFSPTGAAVTRPSALFCVCLLFLVLLLVTLAYDLRELVGMVYRDGLTGLYNKVRWNELLHAEPGGQEPIGILVLDLNGLKEVNDALGHEAGDRLIADFADILRRALPSSALICRWGGDEFAVMLPGITRSKLEVHLESLNRITGEYNDSAPERRIHFALGDALSEEYPGKTRRELFYLADRKMYRDKQEWYAEREKADGIRI